MATLGDLHEAFGTLKVKVGIYGVSERMKERIKQLEDSIRVAVMGEHGIDDGDRDRAVALPDYTVLKERGEALLKEIRTLLGRG